MSSPGRVSPWCRAGGRSSVVTSVTRSQLIDGYAGRLEPRAAYLNERLVFVEP
jgi:hypothetical protein